MSNLIPLSNNDGDIAVMGRDLHAFLCSREPYTRWIARHIEKYGFSAGQDFMTKMSESTGGRPSEDHVLTLDMAKEISMLQANERGKQARQYFIECEKQHQSRTPALPDRRALAQMVIEAEDRASSLEKQVALTAPKAEYHDRFISEDSDVMTIDDWAAQYGIAKGDGLKILRDKKIIYRKAVTRELSQKRGEQVDRHEHRSYKPHRHMFALRPQLRAPRYNNGQMRQTLYVRVAYSTQLAEAAGINHPEGLF